MPSGKRPKGRVPEYARGKQAVAVPVTTRNDRLSWRLAGIDLGGPWSWRKMTAVELAMLHAKIRDFETMTADEVFARTAATSTFRSATSQPRRATAWRTLASTTWTTCMSCAWAARRGCGGSGRAT